MAKQIKPADEAAPAGNSARDARGRFRKGSSGNPLGRPRKQPLLPRSLQESVMDALYEVVSVTGPGGSEIQMYLMDLLVRSSFKNSLKSRSEVPMRLLLQLYDKGMIGEAPSALSEEGGCFTEEDRRLIEIIQREIHCPKCDQHWKDMQ